MAVSTPYLNSNNLHFKPFCARIGRAVLWSATTLERQRSNHWHGHVVHFASKTVLLLGAAATVPLALIEAVGIFAIGLAGVAFNSLICLNTSEFLQKHSVQCISYALHSLLVSIALFATVLKNPNLTYYTLNAVADHTLHIGSAAATQLTLGLILDRVAGRSPHSAVVRTVNLFVDSHPDLLIDLANQIQTDFELNLRGRMREIPHWEAFLNGHPDDRAFIETFDFTRLLREEPYRIRTADLARRFLHQARLVGAAAPGDDPLRFDLNQNTPQESAYQNRLAGMLKASFLEIHRTPALARCLDKEGDSGADLLEMLDAATYVPLTAYTQLKELEQPIECPAAFSANLTRYNERRAQLIEARNELLTLTPEEKQRLVEKVLKGSDANVEEKLQGLYRKIGVLAAPLYQGPLMTKTAINLRHADDGNIIDVWNLFQKACQEAIAELPRPA